MMSWINFVSWSSQWLPTDGISPRSVFGNRLEFSHIPFFHMNTIPICHQTSTRFTFDYAMEEFYRKKSLIATILQSHIVVTDQVHHFEQETARVVEVRWQAADPIRCFHLPITCTHWNSTVEILRIHWLRYCPWRLSEWVFSHRN